MANLSLCYADDPEAAIRALDQLLSPGGILKATFFSEQSRYELGKSSREFVRTLLELGYDVQVKQVESDNLLSPIEGEREVVVAVKSGAQPGAAAMVAQEDQKRYLQQRRAVRRRLQELVWRWRFGKKAK
jgi:SAM-dependent methyltransferase